VDKNLGAIMASSLKWRLAAALGISLMCNSALAEAPSNAELQRQIEELKQQIRLLTEKLSNAQPPPPQPDLGKQVKAQQEQIEVLAKHAEENKKSDWTARTRIGGYGELHYNNLDGEGGASDLDQVDFHRFVLYFGHDFNERVRFKSELELEHAFIEAENECELVGLDVECEAEAPGEVELEQAYVEFDVNQDVTAKAGLFLVPVGILNETHEPPTFYGVERNPVENAIIPATWWAGGAGATWRFAEGWALDAAVHEGLKTEGPNFAVRSGRQKTAEASAKDPAVTTRLKWTGLPGLELAAAVQYQSDITQDDTDSADDAVLYETHADFRRGALGIRALYAAWDLDGNGPDASGGDRQEGYYLEPSWRFNDEWGVFARFSEWDNRAGDNGPGNTEKTQYNVGFNYWPIQNVVLKADYQIQDHENDANQDGLNVGVGYQF
jgi:hypothetical protein